MTEPEGRWAAMRGALQIVDLLQRSVPGPEPASSVLQPALAARSSLWSVPSGGSPTSSFPLCSMISNALGLPRGASPRLPPARGNDKRLVGRYCALLAACLGCDSRTFCFDFLPKQRLYIETSRPRVPGRPQRRVGRPLDKIWTLGVQNALRAGDVLPAHETGRIGGSAPSGPGPFAVGPSEEGGGRSQATQTFTSRGLW